MSRVAEIAGLREQIKANARAYYQESDIDIVTCFGPSSCRYTAKIIRSDMSKTFMVSPASELAVEALFDLLCKVSWELGEQFDKIQKENSAAVEIAPQTTIQNVNETATEPVVSHEVASTYLSSLRDQICYNAPYCFESTNVETTFADGIHTAELQEGEWTCQGSQDPSREEGACSSFEPYATILVGRSTTSELEALENLLSKSFVDLNSTESVARDMAYTKRFMDAEADRLHSIERKKRRAELSADDVLLAKERKQERIERKNARRRARELQLGSPDIAESIPQKNTESVGHVLAQDKAEDMLDPELPQATSNLSNPDLQIRELEQKCRFLEEEIRQLRIEKGNAIKETAGAKLKHDMRTSPSYCTLWMNEQLKIAENEHHKGIEDQMMFHVPRATTEPIPESVASKGVEDVEEEFDVFGVSDQSSDFEFITK